MDDLIFGLELLRRHHPNLQVGAAHDKIVVGPINLSDIDPEIFKSLRDRGWHYCEEETSMGFFT